MRHSLLKLLLPALVLACGCIAEGQSSPAAPDVKLPPPDPRVQAWISAIAWPGSLHEQFAALEEVLTAKQNGSLNDDVWITQCLQCLLSAPQMNGEGELFAGNMLLNVSRTYSLIQPARALEVLAPYLDSGDPKVAKRSGEMLSAFLVGPETFDLLETYVRSRGRADSSWRIVGMMFGFDPNRALTLMAKIHLDRAGQLRVDRSQKELQVLILSYDLAENSKQIEAAEKVSAKMRELSDSPNWFERVYVLTIINQTSAMPSSRAHHWPGELDIQTHLSQDPNPLVRRLTPMARYPQFKNPG